MGSFLKILGYLCFIFAVVDFGLALFGVDITGSQYSPLIAGVVGEGFLWVGKKLAPEPEDANADSVADSVADAVDSDDIEVNDIVD